MCEEKLIKLGLFSLRREQNFKKPYLGLEEGILLLSTGLQVSSGSVRARLLEVPSDGMRGK